MHHTELFHKRLRQLLLIGAVLATCDVIQHVIGSRWGEYDRLVVLLWVFVGGIWIYLAWKAVTALSHETSITRLLLSQCPDWVMVLSEHGVILYVNEQAKTFVGYSPDELKGNHIRALFHPSYRATIMKSFGEVLRFGIESASCIEAVVQHHDGHTIHVELALSLHQVKRLRYFIVSIRDVSERHRQEQKLRRALYTLDRIVYTIPQAVFIADVNKDRITYTGKEETLGLTQDEVIKLGVNGFLQMVHPEDQQQVKETMHQALQLSDGSSISCVYRFRTKEKGWRTYYMRLAVFQRNEKSGAVEKILLVMDDMTELMKVRSEREQLNERLRLAAQAVGIGVWEVDFDANTFIWDDVMYRHHGLPDKLIGEEFTEAFRKGVPPAMYEKLVNQFKESKVGIRTYYDVTYQFTKPNGEEHYFHAIGKSYFNPLNGNRCLIGITIDETEVERQRRQREKLEHLLAESQRMARIASWEIDPSTITVVCSQELWNLYGLTPQDGPLSVTLFKNHIHPEDLSEWQSHLEGMLNGHATDVFRYRIIRANDHQLRWLQCSGEQIFSDGKLIALRGTVQDITEQYYQEQQLIEAREEALRASRVKSEFLANMSHEIRTPMNAILGFASLLERSITDPPLREYISAIRSGGNTLLQLINDILDLSKLEAGRMRLSPEPTDLRVFIEEVRMFLGERAESKGLELRTEVIGTLPSIIELDTVRMRQVLFNLVGNAIKFTDSGYVAIRAYGNPNGDGTWRIILEVEDTGIGIPEDQLDAIFEAFQQVEGQSTRKFGGTGLGLSICKKLVQLMEGSISVRSTVNVGTLFTVILPNVCESSAELVAISGQEVPSAKVSFDGAVIVVVDDVESNRALVRSYLEFHGAVVHEASSADDAEKHVTVVNPIAIFTDVQMPIRSGIDLARSLRNSPQWQDLPIVAVTATPLRDEEDAALFNAILLKPITLESFLDVACRVLPFKACHEHEQQDSSEEYADLDQEVQEALCQIVPHWRSASERLVSSDIERFIESLETVVQRSSSTVLIRYLDHIRCAYKQFDIVTLRKQLEYFPQFLLHKSDCAIKEKV